MCLKRFRNHPSIALWCSGNEGVCPEPLHEKLNQLIYELDGTRYFQPNSRLMNMREQRTVVQHAAWKNIFTT